MNKAPSYPPPYTVIDGCLYQEIMQGKSKLTKKLCNFAPYLTAEVVHDDGAELKRFYPRCLRMADDWIPIRH